MEMMFDWAGEVDACAGDLIGGRHTWSLQDIKTCCKLTADGSGPPTKWLHKNIARWRKHLEGAGLPPLVSSTPYRAQSARKEDAQGMHLDFYAGCTPVLHVAPKPFSQWLLPGGIAQPSTPTGRPPPTQLAVLVGGAPRVAGRGRDNGCLRSNSECVSLP